MKIDHFFSKSWEWGYVINPIGHDFWTKCITINIMRAIGLDFSIQFTKVYFRFSLTLLCFNINIMIIYNPSLLFEDIDVLKPYFSKNWEWGKFTSSKGNIFYDKSLTITIGRYLGLEFDISVSKISINFSLTLLCFHINASYLFNKKPFIVEWR